MRGFLSISLLLFTSVLFSQVELKNAVEGDANSTLLLDVQSTTDGVLIPRVTTTERKGLIAAKKEKFPEFNVTQWEGMLVYDTDLEALVYIHNGKWLVLLKD